MSGKSTTKHTVPNYSCTLIKNGGKFFKRVSPADWTRYQAACQVWEREKERLPFWCEANCWGVRSIGYWSFAHAQQKVIAGKSFVQSPFDWKGNATYFSDPVSGAAGSFLCAK